MSHKTNFVFLHGGGQGSWVWEETISALRQQAGGDACRILTLDIPGCGLKQQRDTGDIAFNDILCELISDIETAGMEDVVLVGHSQAGTILPKLAELRPELFRELVYVSCSLPLPGQTVIQMIGDDVHGANEDEVGWPVDPKTHSMRERTEIMLCNDMDEEETAAFMARLKNDQWPTCSYLETSWNFARLGEVPATYIICLKDNILPVKWQRVFAKRFGVENVVNIDAGHQVMNTRPHALSEILRSELPVIYNTGT